MTVVTNPRILSSEESDADAQEAERFVNIVRYNIRRYMRLTGKLQKDLARAMGVTRPAVTLMLNGNTKPKLDQVFLAAKELGVSVEALMDDRYFNQDEEFLAKMRAQENEKAPGEPGASNKLLRLGLNQRPSD